MTGQKEHFHPYPLFLKLNGRRCSIIGGGKTAERKAASLLEAGAAVTVISPEATAAVQSLARDGRIAWQQKSFAASDLESVFLVIAATDDPAVNTGIAALCRARGVLVNVVDEPELCDFLVPSVLRRGALAIAVSTEGKSPLLAQKLRRDLEKIFTGPYAEFLELVGEQRNLIKATVSDPEKREAIFRSLIDSDIFNLLAAGKCREAQEELQKCISSQQG